MTVRQPQMPIVRAVARSLRAALLAAALLPAAAFAQDDALKREIEGFSSQIDALEAEYLKPVRLESKYELDARYNDGRVAYRMGQYQRAASLLHSVIDDPQFKSYGGYREAVYMLGDALYRVRNYLGAVEQFEKIVASGAGQYYAEAAARLLEIAYESRDFDRLDALHARLSGAGMSGQIAYLAGKAFYEQGNHERAREAFARAAQSPEYRPRAEYFRGVSFVAEKKLGDAKRIFTALAQPPAVQNDAESRVADLSWLALGRIAYEEGMIEEAIDFYARLERTSPYFDQSLWEQTWVLVSRGNFEEARRNVDIITYLEDPDPEILAKSQLLRAHLSLKLGEYDTARADYQAVLDRFTPIQRQMDEFATANQDMSAFFATLAASRAGDHSGLPPLIYAWVTKDPEMRAATASLRTMQQAEESIAESYRLLDELAARLGPSARVQSFPELADGFAAAVKIEERLLQIRQELVDGQYASAQSTMSSTQKATWSTLSSELADLRAKVEAIPQTRAELATRQREVTAEFDRLRRRLDETGQEIEGQQAQLEALQKYLSGESGRPISKTEREEAEKAKLQLEQRLAELGALQQQLTAEVEALRQGVGEGDPVRQAEEQLRSRYAAKLGEAEQFLDALGGGGGTDARLALVRVRGELDAFFGELDALAAQAVGGLAEDVAAQRRLTDQHRESLQQLITASQSGAGVLAYVNFMKARSEYTELVLRGEVGIIDVVWQKKEDLSGKISKLFEDRTSELNLLQEAFEEVR